MKIKCLRCTPEEHFTEGDVYEIINGNITSDNGYEYTGYTLDSWNRFYESWGEFEEVIEKKTLIEYFAELHNIEEGDTFDLSHDCYNPHSILNGQIFDCDGDKINGGEARDIFDGKVTVNKKVTTKTITIDGKDIEISLESFNALKEQLIGDE